MQELFSGYLSAKFVAVDWPNNEERGRNRTKKNTSTKAMKANKKESTLLWLEKEKTNRAVCLIGLLVSARG
ncbi:hypothetical protein [Hoylesella loescheii]|uniref:hypothetical protein n=1 Tax=Hoylesella loescheii TaxID=840 RepID=UPI0028E2294C|nr:hypothetical protein [Hoylesella loescheii]